VSNLEAAARALEVRVLPWRRALLQQPHVPASAPSRVPRPRLTAPGNASPLPSGSKNRRAPESAANTARLARSCEGTEDDQSKGPQGVGERPGARRPPVAWR